MDDKKLVKLSKVLIELRRVAGIGDVRITSLAVGNTWYYKPDLSMEEFVPKKLMGIQIVNGHGVPPLKSIMHGLQVEDA